MKIDVTKLSNRELDNLIENHKRKDKIDAPLYGEALAERAARKGKGLNFEKTLSIVRRAALENKFLSYKDIADESGVRWLDVHYSIGSHLFELVKYAHAKGWPMLSAIVVNKPNVKTGKMDDETLKGFISAAKALKRPVLDDHEFLRTEQQAVFAWARGPGDEDNRP